MGVAAGTMALREAGRHYAEWHHHRLQALGVSTDTGVFLTKMIENREKCVEPDTVHSINPQYHRIADCIAASMSGINQTYTQRAFSFEHSLIDAILELKENADQYMLVGGSGRNHIV
jgi:hypothetical protein